MGRVEIGKQVDYKTLETALVKAAEEIGWKAKVQDKFERNYKLGSVQETQDYSHTMVNLRGRVFPAMKVYISNKSPTDRFYVWQGFPCGLVSERKIQEYLSAVSRNL
ncbi:MAG: hypothetical protein ABIE36_00965 [Candidatus Diapherotrites archaeon]